MIYHKYFFLVLGETGLKKVNNHLFRYLVHPQQEIAKLLYVPLPQEHQHKSFLSATIMVTTEGFFTGKKILVFSRYKDGTMQPKVRYGQQCYM